MLTHQTQKEYKPNLKIHFFFCRNEPIKLGKLQKLDCPFKEEHKCQLTSQQKNDHHDFRMHFFLHYRSNTEHWDPRLKSLEKDGNLSMYCDLCPIRKKIKAATENGLRSSVICHLAVIHDELRDVMEKDERLDKEFIQAVYYDVDLKKLQSSGGIAPKNEGKTEIATKKSSPPPPKKQTPGPAK